MDVSNLREKPAGRRPVETRALPLERMDELIARLKRALADGARAFWVCPLVEESETLDVAAAQDRCAHLREVFGDKVGLVHGKMKSRDKDAAMAASRKDQPRSSSRPRSSRSVSIFRKRPSW